MEFWNLVKAMGIVVGPLYLVVGWILKDQRWILKFVTNHYTSVTRDIERIKAKLEIEEEEKE